MNPSPEKQVLRWTAHESEIVIQMADEQLALEKDNPSEEIPWTLLWKQVSKCLEANGYGRSPNACNLHYRKFKEIEVLARPPWDALEHQILVGVTTGQLDLQKKDPSKKMPWPKLWKRASRKINDNGYYRSPDSCAAYYEIIRKHQVCSVLDDGHQSACDNVDDQPSYSFFQDTETSPEASKKSSSLSSWSPDNESDDAIICTAPSLVRGDSLQDSFIQPTQTKPPSSGSRSPRELAQSVFLAQVETPVPWLNPLRGEQENNLNPQTPLKFNHTPKLSSSFRFTDEQRATLVQELAQNCRPDKKRRGELAEALKVKEASIKNWFSNNGSGIKRNRGNFGRCLEQTSHSNKKVLLSRGQFILPASGGQYIAANPAGNTYDENCTTNDKPLEKIRVESSSKHETLEVVSPTSPVNYRTIISQRQDVGHTSGQGADDREPIRCICQMDEYYGQRHSNLQEGSAINLAGFFVQCDLCRVWQHGGCVGIIDAENSPDDYFCDECRPDLHDIGQYFGGPRYSRYKAPRVPTPAIREPLDTAMKILQGEDDPLLKLREPATEVTAESEPNVQAVASPKSTSPILTSPLLPNNPGSSQVNTSTTEHPAVVQTPAQLANLNRSPLQNESAPTSNITLSSASSDGPPTADLPLSSATTQAISEEDEHRAFLFKIIQTLSLQVQNIKADAALQLVRVTTLGQEMAEIENRRQEYQRDKEEYLRRVMEETEQRYKRKHDALDEEMEVKRKESDGVVEGLGQKSVEVRNTTKRINRFQRTLDDSEKDVDNEDEAH